MKMKRKMKNKKITSPKYSKKDKRKKIYLRRPFLPSHFLEIGSPHNTNEYLINVNSSNFWNNNNEESLDIIPSSLIFLNDDSNEELNIFINRENDTTKENTELFKDNKGQKGQEICKIKPIKF